MHWIKEKWQRFNDWRNLRKMSKSIGRHLKTGSYSTRSL